MWVCDDLMHLERDKTQWLQSTNMLVLRNNILNTGLWNNLVLFWIYWCYQIWGKHLTKICYTSNEQTLWNSYIKAENYIMMGIKGTPQRRLKKHCFCVLKSKYFWEFSSHMKWLDVMTCLTLHVLSFSYVGHGAGARFLDGQTILKTPIRAASLLFGCSSAALAVRGDQEGQGIILNYLIAGWWDICVNVKLNKDLLIHF